MKTPKTTSKSAKPPVLHRLIRDMSSARYHGSVGTWSSSQKKDMIDDEEVFIKKYIHGKKETVESEVFDTGTYFHTGVLEPHKVATEIAVFSGKTRYGKDWNAFKAKHAGKCIITSKQKEVGDGMIRAVKASPVCMEYLVGDPELSLFVRLVVWKGRIYAPNYGKMLTPDGWTSMKKEAETASSKGYELIVKVRADCLGETFVSDLKSTSGKATQAESVRSSISKYKYDLSAALYLDMFSLVRPEVTAFIWIFASKENPRAAAWLATRNQILVGRAKWSWAVKRMADLAASNWEIPEALRDAEPLPYELEWLREKETDLL